jgi:hypothetical protein
MFLHCQKYTVVCVCGGGGGREDAFVFIFKFFEFYLKWIYLIKPKKI